MHVTQIYSKTPCKWPVGRDEQLVVRKKSGRTVEALGDGGAVVLRFENDTLGSRWQELIDEYDAKSDFPSYIPHVTISWDASNVDLEAINPYTGPLVFGPEIMRVIKPDWKAGLVEKGADMTDTFSKAQVVKVDDSLGLVFGWAIVCKKDGEPYFDLQGDYIPEESMLKATADFMVKSRVNKEMHTGSQQGTVVFSFPLTTDIAKAMGIASDQTGWMVAVKPDNAEALAKFKDGTYTGFSIGGNRITDKELD